MSNIFGAQVSLLNEITLSTLRGVMEPSEAFSGSRIFSGVSTLGPDLSQEVKFL